MGIVWDYSDFSGHPFDFEQLKGSFRDQKKDDIAPNMNSERIPCQASDGISGESERTTNNIRYPFGSIRVGDGFNPYRTLVDGIRIRVPGTREMVFFAQKIFEVFLKAGY